MKVACILDEFSYNCFKYEEEFTYLNKNNWLVQLEETKPDLLFVESFWYGYQSDWSGELNNLQLKKDSEIKRMVSYCKSKGIKTVFWNKEDPVNYDHFIEGAKLFEYIFTTDENCIDRYKEAIGHSNVWSLSFAAQPKLHNPINVKYDNEFSIMFAGSWYSQFFVRQEEMKLLLNAASKKNLKIFDRNYDAAKNRTRFPGEYQSNVIGSLPYIELLKHYKNTAVQLNVNTERDSLNMFSRRVYEVLACSRILLSTYSKGILETFNSDVKISTYEEDSLKFLNDIEDNIFIRKQIGINAMHKIYREHLYEHRWNFIISKVFGYNKRNSTKKIHVFSIVDSYNNFLKVYEIFRRQKYDQKNLYIISENNELKLDKYNDCQVVTMQEIASLKMNSTDLVTYFNPKDYYSDQYLDDLFYATLYGEGDVITKAAYYVQKREINRTLENQYVEPEKFNVNAFILEREDISNLRAFFTSIATKNIESTIKCINFSEKRLLSINNFFYIANSDASLFNFDNILKINSDFNYNKHYEKIMEKAREYSKSYKGINEIFKSIIASKRNIYLYAAGVHTVNLLNKLIDVEPIQGIFDKNPSYKGESIKDIPIINTQLLLNKVGQEITIIISSYDFDQEIYSDLIRMGFNPNQIISLYQNYKEHSKDIFKELYSDYTVNTNS